MTYVIDNFLHYQKFSTIDLKVLITKLKKDNKSTEDAKIIYEIIKQTPFFSNLFEGWSDTITLDGVYQVKTLNYKKLCRNLQYQLSETNCIIMRENELSDGKFYMILTGSVGVYIKKQKIKHQQQELIEEIKDDEVRDYKLGNLQNLLTDGVTFGEKVFFAENVADARRSASLQAKSDTHLLIMLKKQSSEILKWYGKHFKQKQQALLRLIPKLEEAHSKQTIDILIYYFEDQKLYKGNYITQEGQLSELVHFLAEGKCTISKSYSKQLGDNLPKQYLKQSQHNKLSKEEAQEKRIYSDLQSQKLDEDDIVPKSFKFREINLLTLDTFNIVGEESINDLDIPLLEWTPQPSLYSVKIISQNALVYSIKAVTLYKLFAFETVQKLISQFQSKELIRKELFLEKTAQVEEEPKYFDKEKETMEQININNLKKLDANYIKQNGDALNSDLQFYRKFASTVKDTILLRKKMKQNLILDEKVELKIEDQKLIDTQFLAKQSPQRSLHPETTKKREQVIIPRTGVKISMLDFIRMQKQQDQGEMLKLVENPYDFASNVNAQDFLKQYYSNLIKIGLVKPQTQKYAVRSASNQQIQTLLQKSQNTSRMLFQSSNVDNIQEILRIQSAIGGTKTQRGTLTKRKFQVNPQLDIISYDSNMTKLNSVTRSESRQSSPKKKRIESDHLKFTEPDNKWISEFSVKNDSVTRLEQFQFECTYKDKGRIRSGMASSQYSHRSQQSQSIYIQQQLLRAQQPESIVQFNMDPNIDLNNKYQKNKQIKKGLMSAPYLTISKDLNNVLVKRNFNRIKSIYMK